MRITGGDLRNRIVKVPDGIRPSQDIVRQAIYSALAERVPGARVLDLYAGSGAMGLEAWSRGAAAVTWVEKDARVFAVLQGNVAQLAGGAAEARCVRGEVDRYLAGETGVYDLVLADPPYEQTRDGVLLQKTLRALMARPMVRRGGVLVFEQGIAGAVAEPPGWRLVRDRTYGGTRVLIYVFDHVQDSDLPGDV
jgi:16S rRNA (guanine966-N2)-methyltransferase